MALCGQEVMRIEGDNSWIELVRREDDEEEFDVKCSVGEFSGRNGQIWIDANEQRLLLEALRSVERNRRGEASLKTMSPEEFELVVRVVDLAGHVFVEGLISKLHFSAHRHRYNRLLLKFGFEVAPTFLPQVLWEADKLLAAA